MGCLQSYFRKGSYDVYEAHSTGLSPSPSSAAAAVTTTTAKPSTPPGSNGHAPEGADGSPPPRPPPKKSHEAKALAAAAKDPDPSQPPALPPKRHSKASSGSQPVKEQQPGVEPGGTATKAESAPPEKEEKSEESSSTQPEKTGEHAESPAEGASRTTPLLNDTIVSEATDTPGGTDSSAALSPLKKDDGSTSPVADSRDESKSPGTGDAMDGSQMSTPGPLETVTPTSVVISPPGDPEGSVGEKESSLEEPPATPSSEAREESRDTPGSRPQSTGKAPEVAITPPEDEVVEEVEEVKDDAVPRPNSVASKEMESTSVVSGSIVTDSAIAEGTPSEAGVRRSAGGGEEGVVVSAEGVATPKGRDSGLSSEEGSTPLTVGRDSGQGPSAGAGGGEAGEGPAAAGSGAAIEVSGEVNKTESPGAAGSSRPASAVGEKTAESPTSADVCKSPVVEESGREGEDGGTTDDVEGEKVGKEKSFGFGDSASMDTVVHVKTEGSTEIPNASSQEKAVSPLEQPETKSAGEMPEEGAKAKETVEAKTTESPATTTVTEESGTATEVPLASMAEGGSVSPVPSSPTKETEVSSPPPTLDLSPPAAQNEPVQPSPTEETPSPPAGDVAEDSSVAESKPPPMSLEKEAGASSPPITAVVVEDSQNEPPPTSPKNEAPSSPPLAAVGASESEPPPPSPTKETEAPPAGTISASASQEQPSSPPSTEEGKGEVGSGVEGEVPEEPAVDEKAESPKDKSEPTSEELPPPPPPEMEKEGEQQGGEVMPPPPPPTEVMSAAPQAETQPTEGPRSQERPLSVTEEEVASILLGQTTADTKDKDEDQKDLPPPPPSSQEGNLEGAEFPPPPEMSEDGEIRSPVDADGRTRSASFELVEVLNLGGSLEEGEEGEKEGAEPRQGRGLVKRVPTPVNADWPPNHEEEEDGEDEEERDSISPEATATPSVTSESKQSLEDAEGTGGGKMTKDATSGSLEGISEVPSMGGQAKDEEADKGSAAPASTGAEPGEVVVEGTEAKAVKGSPTIEGPPEPSAPDEEVIVPEGGGRVGEEDVEVPECAVTNHGPPPEVVAAADDKLNREEAGEEERPMGSEEVRKEVEEVGRMEVEEVIKKAVVEAERRDRESRMSGEFLDDDTVVVEAAANGDGAVEDDVREEVKGAAATQGSGEVKDSPETEKPASEGTGKVTPVVSQDETKAVVEDAQKAKSSKETVPKEKEGIESPEATTDAVGKETREKEQVSPEVMADPATKVKTSPAKSRAEGEINGEAETERRSATQSEEVQSPRDAGEEEAIDGGGGTEEEAAAAVKIQSTFRGYVVRRDAGKAAGRGGAEGEGGAREEGGGGPGGASPKDDDSSLPALAADATSGVSHQLHSLAEDSLGADGEEDRRVWERLEQERRDQAASCIQRGFREFRESGGQSAKRLRREDALAAASSSSGSSSSFPGYGHRSSGEFHDHVVLPPLESADVTGADTGGMRQGCGVPTDGSAGPQGGAGAMGLMDSAAARIQAGYRGYRVRKRLREVQNNGPPSNHRDSPSSQSEGSGGGKGGRKEEEGEAATKIQAGVRGFLTRRRLKRKRREGREEDGENRRRSPTEEAEKAAVKIQAGFRGYKGRQRAKARRQQDDGKKEVK